VPLPERARRPRPVTDVLAQCAIVKFRASLGVRLSVLPVHASSPLRCVTAQSVVPSRWRTQKEVCGERVAMRSEVGVVDVMRW
jgi:hypothetical protein